MKPRRLLAIAAVVLIVLLALALGAVALFEIVSHLDFGW
jgi:hypothetical protein